MTIFDQLDEITTEIKKKGLFFDLDSSLELLVGDKLTFYLCRGINQNNMNTGTYSN